MSPFFRSVRFRLTLWYSAILGLVLVVFALVLYATVRYQLLHHHDDGLKETARSVVSILEREPDCAHLTSPQVADLGRLDRLVLIHEMAGQGHVFYRSPDLDPRLLPHGQAELRKLLARSESFETVDGPSGMLRVYSVRYTSNVGRQGVVRVMDSLGDAREGLSFLRWSLLGMVPLALLVSGAGGYWLAARALRPVDQVTRLAREIGAKNLSLRLPAPATDDELGRLVATFNQMIDRLQFSFESMQRFTADASHELKTPLAALRVAIDVALSRERTGEEYRRSLAALSEAVERLTGVVDDLLLLARADAGSLPLEREPLRLDELVADVAAALEPLAEARGVRLAAETPAAVTVAGDERWLRQMLYNLIDNAIKYSGDRGAVRVGLESQDGTARVSVADTGPGIPEEEQGRLFERFYRADQSRARGTVGGIGGAGLGLSIALWVARSHGGDIEVESRPGAGSTFWVVLPLQRSGGLSS